MGKRVFMNICESCHGYTTDEEMTECPVCGGELAFKPIDVKDKAKYKNLDDMGFDDFASDNEPSFDDPLDDDYTEPKKRNNTSNNNTDYDDTDVDFTPKSRSSSTSRSSSLSSGESFTGIVYSYRNSDNDGSNYSRLFVMRLWDAIIYRQRMEDVLHYFRLHTSSGKDLDGMEVSKDINVNVHGTIVGGAHLADNSRLTVRGKFKNGVLMASDITDDDSGSHIRFRRSYKAIATTIVLGILFLIGLIYGISSSNSVGGVFHNIGVFFGTLAIVYIVLIVIYLIASFTKFGMIMRVLSQRKTIVPWLALFIVAFAITSLILSNLSGIGGGLGSLKGSFSQLLQTLLLYAIIIYGIVLMFKSLK